MKWSLLVRPNATYQIKHYEKWYFLKKYFTKMEVC